MTIHSPVSEASGQDFWVSDLLREAADRAIRIEVLTPAPNLTEGPLYSGRLWADEVQPGLIFAAHDLTYRIDGPVDLAIDPCVICGLLLSGDDGEMEVAGTGALRKRPHHPLVAGFGECTQYRRRVIAGQRSSGIGVNLQPAFFDRFADDIIEGRAMGDLHRFLREGVQMRELPPSEAMSALAKDALQNCYTGDLRLLSMEAAALSLVVGVARQLHEGSARPHSIGGRHHAQVMRAQEILDASLVTPPRVLDLAREVGVNVTTLRENFRMVVGTSIFGYLRQQRLRMARVMMAEHGLRVSEAAYRVGFASPAAFTAAYRREFGSAPREDLARLTATTR